MPLLLFLPQTHANILKQDVLQHTLVNGNTFWSISTDVDSFYTLFIISMKV